MNIKAIIGSIFLGLTLPTFAFANVPTLSSLSSLNQEQFNTSKTIEIAQGYLSPEYVSSRLYRSESQILGIAKGYSDKVRWRKISVKVLSNQRIKLNLYGKIPRKWPVKDPNIRVGLYLQRNSQSGFRFYSYDWQVWGGTCKSPCQNQIKSKLSKLPNEYPRFQRSLNNIVY